MVNWEDDNKEKDSTETKDIEDHVDKSEDPLEGKEDGEKKEETPVEDMTEAKVSEEEKEALIKAANGDSDKDLTMDKITSEDTDLTEGEKVGNTETNIIIEDPKRAGILTFENKVKIIEEFLVSDAGKPFHLKSITKENRFYVYQATERNTWIRMKKGFIIFYKSSIRRAMLRHIPDLFIGIEEERR